MELPKFAEFQRKPIVEVGDYVSINPQYCETKDEIFIIYKVYELHKNGTAVIIPLEDDPDTILKQQTFIHKDKLRVLYEL